MYAIVRAGGRQEKVAVGDVLELDRVSGEAGESLTLPALLLVDGEVEVRVDEVTELVVHPVGEDAEGHADLRCREPGAGRLHHRVGEVLDQPTQLLVEGLDRGRGGPQDRVAEEPDGLDRHVPKSRSATADTTQVVAKPDKSPAIPTVWVVSAVRGG